MRSAPNQTRHDVMVQLLLDDLCAKGYTCRSSATLAESRQEKIYNASVEMFFSPDICAEKEGVPVYFEVETEDSIDSAVTRAELECFLAHARNIRGYFYLVVPPAIRERAVALLRDIDNKDIRRAFVLTL